MNKYTAFVELSRERFTSFEEAIEHLSNNEAGTEGLEPLAVSLVGNLDSEGLSVEPVHGELIEREDTQAYIFTVEHEINGHTFEIKYAVEYRSPDLETSTEQEVYKPLEDAEIDT